MRCVRPNYLEGSSWVFAYRSFSGIRKLVYRDLTPFRNTNLAFSGAFFEGAMLKDYDMWESSF